MMPGCLWLEVPDHLSSYINNINNEHLLAWLTLGITWNVLSEMSRYVAAYSVLYVRQKEAIKHKKPISR